jgi:hypothetical protein
MHWRHLQEELEQAWAAALLGREAAANQTGHHPEFAVELVEQVDACIPLTVTNMNDVRHERPLSSWARRYWMAVAALRAMPLQI